MTITNRRIASAFGVAVGGALLAATTVTAANAYGPDPLPPTWHVHDCTSGCVLPHAPVAFFPSILGETLTDYLADPAQCPDATDKALLGGGQPPTSDGLEPNQPLRAGVCLTSTTVIHLRSISTQQPAPAGWSLQGSAGGYTTYYLLTPR